MHEWMNEKNQLMNLPMNQPRSPKHTLMNEWMNEWKQWINTHAKDLHNTRATSISLKVNIHFWLKLMNEWINELMNQLMNELMNKRMNE